MNEKEWNAFTKGERRTHLEGLEDCPPAWIEYSLEKDWDELFSPVRMILSEGKEQKKEQKIKKKTLEDYLSGLRSSQARLERKQKIASGHGHYKDVSDEVLEELLDEEWNIRALLAENPNTPERILRKLVDDERESVRIKARETLGSLSSKEEEPKEKESKVKLPKGVSEIWKGHKHVEVELDELDQPFAFLTDWKFPPEDSFFGLRSIKGSFDGMGFKDGQTHHGDARTFIISKGRRIKPSKKLPKKTFILRDINGWVGGFDDDNLGKKFRYGGKDGIILGYGATSKFYKDTHPEVFSAINKRLADFGYPPLETEEISDNKMLDGVRIDLLGHGDKWFEKVPSIFLFSQTLVETNWMTAVVFFPPSRD